MDLKTLPVAVSSAQSKHDMDFEEESGEKLLGIMFNLCDSSHFVVVCRRYRIFCQCES